MQELTPFNVVTAMALLLTGCAAGRARTAVEEHNMEVVRQAHAALAASDFEAFEASLGPGYVRHCQAMPPKYQELRGTTEFLSFLREFKAAVPKYEDKLSNMIARGDRVAYVSTISGVQSGPLGDLPASNESFTLVNIIMQRLEDGRIVETWVSWDNVAFLTQLGHMLDREPSPAPTAVTRSLTDVHRVVTGRSPLGEVAVVSEGTAPGAITFDSLPGFELLPLWATSAAAKIPDDGRALQPAPGPILPRPEETRFLLLRLPAQREIAAALEAGSSMESFGEELAAQVPELAAARHPENPLLHVTDSVDYVVVLTGEVVLELDGGTQARIHPGDVVIQNGVPHAWHAAGPEGAVLAAVMVGCRR